MDALKFMAQKDEVKKLKSMFEQYQYEDEYDDSLDSFQAVGDADGEGLDPIQPNPNRPVEPEEEDLGDDVPEADAKPGALNAGNGAEDGEEDEEDERSHQRTGAAPGGRGRGGGAPAARGASSTPRGGRGGGRGRGRGRGGPVGDDMSDRQKQWKDRHKSRLANHDRKQRAMKKKGAFAAPPPT